MKIKPLGWLIPFFILVFFYIPSLDPWNALPNALGYFGLFVSFTALLEHERKFVRAQNFALLLFLLELAFLFRLVTSPGLADALELIGYFGCLMMVAYAAGAMSSMAKRFEHFGLERTAESIFYFFMPTVPLKAVSVFAPDLAGLFGYVCLILYIVVLYRLQTMKNGLLITQKLQKDISLEQEEP